MLRKADIDHILRAAAAITNQFSFVLIGTGAVIATARHIPALLMMTPEIDLYVEGDDSEMFSDLIDATIGQGSIFHRTFHYYGDGVGARTAIMPRDWRSRAVTYTTADKSVQALCPSADDIAVAKMCAWREKDVAWLDKAFTSRIARVEHVEGLLSHGLPPEAPDEMELRRRLQSFRPAQPLQPQPLHPE
jgi:hypothetical protein